MIEGQSQRERDRRPTTLPRHVAATRSALRLLYRADHRPRRRHRRQGEKAEQQHQGQKAIDAHEEILLL